MFEATTVSLTRHRQTLYQKCTQLATAPITTRPADIVSLDLYESLYVQ